MMAYIQILAIVLCSCFIQDAFSVVKVRRVTSAAPVDDEAAPQLAGAGGRAAAMPPVRRTTSTKRTVTRTPTAAPAPPPPPPPPPAKYPHLAAVKDMLWNTLEDINRATEYGKLNARAARNTLSNVLSNDVFWSSVIGALRRRVKVTNDGKRAAAHIRTCNALTTAVTSPNAMQGFQDVANEVYGTVSRMQSDVGTDALRLLTEMVDGGEVNRGLDTITSIVKKINFNPRMLVKGFAMLRKTLNLGGLMHMNGGMARGLMSFTSKFSK
ncbi:uncharacterized protein LOC132939600 [Metopolophium dirhodum]|uniref:uncharacterized protein LOC132939600 n=1 Tax=Metopolophium dirhodum TaxID=44670 RepID=UPI00298F87CE|nr:uncharacterized protein LOC132939600 [Metopolophium dirhodum]